MQLRDNLKIMNVNTKSFRLFIPLKNENHKKEKRKAWKDNTKILSNISIGKNIHDLNIQYIIPRE